MCMWVSVPGHSVNSCLRPEAIARATCCCSESTQESHGSIPGLFFASPPHAGLGCELSIDQLVGMKCINYLGSLDVLGLLINPESGLISKRFHDGKVKSTVICRRDLTGAYQSLLVTRVLVHMYTYIYIYMRGIELLPTI